MTVLELRAIDLDHRARCTQQRLRHGFNQPGLTGPRGTKEQEVPDRPARTRHPGQPGLVDAHDLIDGVILANDATVQTAAQFPCIATGFEWVEFSVESDHHLSLRILNSQGQCAV